MKTIQTGVVVEAGAYRVPLVIDDRPIGPKSDLKDFPVHDVGPWPEGLSPRREDMYGDDGR